MKRWLLIVIGVVVLIGVLAAGWAAWTVRSAEQHLRAAESHLVEARSAIADLDPDAAVTAVAAAKVESSAAAELARRPIWSAVAAVPKVGDTPTAARSLVFAADAAVSAVSGIAQAAAELAGGDLYADGRVDLDAVRAAGSAASGAGEALQVATAHLDAMPTASAGDWVLPLIDDARSELADQVTELASATEVLDQAGDLLPRLLGADEPQKYFIAVQSPNETRGTGGIVGTWAVLEADAGRIAVLEVGSSLDIRTLPTMPEGLDAEFVARYGQAPRRFPNMNISPDFPSAARLWLAGWKAARGEQLDGVLGIDVVALGDLLSGTGVVLTAPDGKTLTGKQFADFALVGLYQKFPTDAQTLQRKAYLDSLARQALRAVLGGGDATALVRALADPVAQRRVAVWVDDPEVQAVIADTALGHGLQPAQPHAVEPVLINVGWSKLDTYLERRYDYQVGRCPDEAGIVRSLLTMTVTSEIPAGAVLPEYVVGAVPVGPEGPVNQVILQGHLPPGAEVLDVEVDGQSSQYWDFTEAGRPAFGYSLDLPPRQAREVRVTFLEPADEAAGVIVEQPMARRAALTLGEAPC